jgi:hypothetical protein
MNRSHCVYSANQGCEYRSIVDRLSLDRNSVFQIPTGEKILRVTFITDRASPSSDMLYRSASWDAG